MDYQSGDEPRLKAQGVLYHLSGRDQWVPLDGSNAWGMLHIHTPDDHPELRIKFFPNQSRDFTSWTLWNRNLKQHEPKSFVVKAVQDGSEDVTILAVRFVEAPDAEKFHTLFLHHNDSESIGMWEALNSPPRRRSSSSRRSSPRRSSPNLDDSKWSCSACTYANFDEATECEICHSKRPTRPRRTVQFEKPRERRHVSEGEWQCSACTFLNEGLLDKCSICETPKSVVERPESDWMPPRLERAPTRYDFENSAIDLSCDPTFQRSVLTKIKSIAEKLLDGQYHEFLVSDEEVGSLIEAEYAQDFLNLLGYHHDENHERLVCGEPPPRDVVAEAIAVLDDMIEASRPNRLSSVGGSVHDHLLGIDEKEAEQAGHRQKQNSLLSPSTAGISPEQFLYEMDAKNEANEAAETDFYTLAQIVLWITHHNQQERDDQDVLLLCFPMFSDARTLVRTCHHFFFQSPDIEWSSDEQKQEYDNQQKQVQIKIVSLLIQAVVRYWQEDFHMNLSNREALEGFVGTLSQDESKSFYIKLGTKLQSAIDKCVDKEQSPRMTLEQLFSTVQQLDERGVSRLMGGIRVNEIADQITLIDYHLFSSIRERECLNKGWKRDDKAIRSPNVMACIQQFNRFTKWAQMQVLNPKSLKDRVKAMSRILKMGLQFWKRQNYGGLMAVFGAMTSAPIARLKVAYGRVAPKHKHVMEEMEKLFNSQGNWKALRAEMRGAVGPRVPYVGLYLQDLFNIHEAVDSRNSLADTGMELFNFDRARRSQQRIKSMLQSQKIQYHIEPHLVLQRTLYEEMCKYDDFSDDEVYHKSTEVKQADISAQSRPWSFRG